MALPIITIKNVDIVTRNACGIRFLAGEMLEIEPYDKLALSENTIFLSNLADGYFEVYYDGYILPAERGEAVLKNHVYVKIDGVDFGYAHTIDFKGIFGAVGDGYGGNVEVDGSVTVDVSDIENLNIVLDGYQTITASDDDLSDIYTALDGYSSEANDDGYHRERDELVHIIAEDSYDEVTRTSPSCGGKINNITTWVNSSKTMKIREEQFTYSGFRVIQSITIQYNSSGVAVETLTENFIYSGNKITSVTRVLT